MKCYSYSLIAILVLFVACINFTNLATAQSLQRAKEVGLRKVVGAQKWQLITQHLGEAVFLAFLALVLAISLLENFSLTQNIFATDAIFESEQLESHIPVVYIGIADRHNGGFISRFCHFVIYTRSNF